MNEDHKNDIELDPPCANVNRQHHIGVQVIKFEELTGTIATDQSGRFPIQSRRGNSYIMLLYDYDSNVIDATAIKSREANNLVASYKYLYSHLKEGGVTPQLHKLDNEALKQLIQAIKDNNCNYQPAPSYDHQTNPAERAWQTLKTIFFWSSKALTQNSRGTNGIVYSHKQ